jgi:hypothetical protein
LGGLKLVSGVALQDQNMQEGMKGESYDAYEVHTSYEDLDGSWNNQVYTYRKRTSL